MADHYSNKDTGQDTGTPLSEPFDKAAYKQQKYEKRQLRAQKAKERKRDPNRKEKRQAHIHRNGKHDVGFTRALHSAVNNEGKEERILEKIKHTPGINLDAVNLHNLADGRRTPIEKIKNILKDILKDLVTEDALQSTLENDNQTLLKTLKEQYPDGKIQADRLQILAKKIHLASEREKYAIENSLRILEKIKGEPGPALEPLKKEAEKQQPDAECDEPLAPHEEFCQNARQKLFNEDGTLQEEFLAKAAEAAGMPAKRLRQICNSGENARLRPNESWETLSEALSSFEA